MSAKLKTKPIKSKDKANEKSTLIQLRIKPAQKESLDIFFDQLGMSTTQAIYMFLAEVDRTGKVPLNLELTTTTMKNEKEKIYELTESEMKDFLESYNEIKQGNFKTLKSEDDIDNFIKTFEN